MTRLTEDSADGNLGATEKLLQEREQEVRTLKKRLDTAKDNESYIQDMYKEGTAAVTSINAENARLKAENEKLQEAASENRLRIHEIQTTTPPRSSSRKRGSRGRRSRTSRSSSTGRGRSCARRATAAARPARAASRAARGWAS